MIGGPNQLQQLLQGARQVADQRQVHVHVLVDLGLVDFNVDLAGVRGVVLQIAGHPVVEAHPEGQQQVGFLDGLVDEGLAVHAHHAQVERVVGWEAAQPQQGHRDRGVGTLGKLLQLGPGSAHQHAPPRQNDRVFGRLDHLGRFLQVAG